MNTALLKEVQQSYHRLTCLLIRKHMTVSTMESCTSGMIASLITDTEGASEIFPGSSVVYCNREKTAAGVPEEIIRRCSVYSVQTAGAMAEAAAEKYHTDIGIGVTGCFSGPDPANPEGIPGRVYFAVCCGGQLRCCEMDISPELSRAEAKMTAALGVARETAALIEEDPR